MSESHAEERLRAWAEGRATFGAGRQLKRDILDLLTEQDALREALRKIATAPPAEHDDVTPGYWFEETLHLRGIARKALAALPTPKQQEEM